MISFNAASNGHVWISAINADPVSRPRLLLQLRDDRLMKVCGHLVHNLIQPAIIQFVAGTSLKNVASDVYGPFFAADDEAKTALILPTYHHEQMMLKRHIGVES